MTKAEEAVREELAREVLDLRDSLDDLLNGIEHWKETKVSSGVWDIHDEFLARWVEARYA